MSAVLSGTPLPVRAALLICLAGLGALALSWSAFEGRRADAVLGYVWAWAAIAAGGLALGLVGLSRHRRRAGR